MLHQSLVGALQVMKQLMNDKFVPLNYECQMYHNLAYLCQKKKKKKKKSVYAHTGS